MNRTDRLLAIIIALQARGQQRAEDLASLFEISKRTIYRDLQALAESGIPLVSIPGKGYSLIDGFFLPPVSLTLNEAIMLLLGCDVMGQNFDAEYRQAAQAAERKIMTVLPPPLRAEVQHLQQRIRFLEVGETPSERLSSLRRAIINQQMVSFAYQDRYQQPSERMADPYALVHHDDAWYLLALCHTRQAMRKFRLTRIHDLTVHEKRFYLPAPFTLRDTRDEEKLMVARVLFQPQVASLVQEKRPFFWYQAEQCPDGCLLVTLHIRDERDILQWLLSWGRHAQVLEPPTLRQRLIEEAQAVLESYKSLLP